MLALNRLRAIGMAVSALGAVALATTGLSPAQWRALSPKQRAAVLDDLSRRMHAAVLGAAIDAYVGRG